HPQGVSWPVEPAQPDVPDKETRRTGLLLVSLSPCLPNLPHHLDFLRLVLYHHPEPEVFGRASSQSLGVFTNNEDGMAKKRTSPSGPEIKAVTSERAARLYRLLH